MYVDCVQEWFHDECVGVDSNAVQETFVGAAGEGGEGHFYCERWVGQTHADVLLCDSFSKKFLMSKKLILMDRVCRSCTTLRARNESVSPLVRAANIAKEEQRHGRFYLDMLIVWYSRFLFLLAQVERD